MPPLLGNGVAAAMASSWARQWCLVPQGQRRQVEHRCRGGVFRTHQPQRGGQPGQSAKAGRCEHVARRYEPRTQGCSWDAQALSQTEQRTQRSCSEAGNEAPEPRPQKQRGALVIHLRVSGQERCRTSSWRRTEIGIGPRRIKQADWGCFVGRLAFCNTDTLGGTGSRSSKGGAVAAAARHLSVARGRLRQCGGPAHAREPLRRGHHPVARATANHRWEELRRPRAHQLTIRLGA